MGYYSIYKIIKDLFFTICRLLKKSTFRFLTIIIIFLLVFCLFSLKNKSEAHVSYYDDIQSFTSGKPWVLYQANNGNIYLVVSPYSDKLLSYGGAGNGVSYFLYSPSNNTNNIQKFNYYIKNEDNTFTFVKNDYGYNNAFGIGAVSQTNERNQVLDMNNNVWAVGKNSYAWLVSDFLNQDPFIVNDTSTIENWSFDNLDINGGSISPYFELNNNNYPYLFNLKITYNNVNYNLDIVDYVSINENNNSFNISIPKAYLTASFNVAENSNFSFILEMTSFDINGDINNTITYNLGDYSFILSTSQVEEQNNNSQRFLEVQNNNNLNNINNNINNSNINSDNISSFNDIDNNMLINDNTRIDDIFQNIYNAFTTKYNDNNIGYGYTLSLPIPFTDKTIDISPHTIYGRSAYDLYENENQYDFPAIQIIYTFATAIWYFIIGAFILKDVRTTINKVAEGKIEDVGSDVKKELL